MKNLFAVHVATCKEKHARKFLAKLEEALFPPKINKQADLLRHSGYCKTYS